MIDPFLLRAYNETRHSGLPANKNFCYAPFSSLYFGHGGKVTACCENRTHELGIYPINTLQEIWNGERARQLRKFIFEQNLWHGCWGCDLDLKSRNFDGIHAKIFDDARISQTNLNYPSLLEFELENTCNLECIMCTGIFSSSIRKNRENLPPIHSPYDDEFVNQLSPFIPHLKKANFFGGEPFLVSIYYQVWDRIAELNPDVQVWVITNGTILNKRIKELLHKMRFNLTLSIDSMNKENYEQIRVNSSFKKVMEHLKYFNEYTKSIQSDLTINTCPMRPNCRDLPEIVKQCNDMGIILKILPVKYPENLSLRSMPSKELREVLDYFRSFNFNETDSISFRNKMQYEYYINLVDQWYQYNKGLEDIETFSKETGLSPKENLLKKIRLHIQSSSGSEKFKKEQLQVVCDKLNRIESTLKERNRLLAEALINIANRSHIEEVVNAVFNRAEDQLISDSRQLFTAEVNHMPGAKDDVDIFFRKLEAYHAVLELCSHQNSPPLSLLIERFENVYNNLKETKYPDRNLLIKNVNSINIEEVYDALAQGKDHQLQDFLEGISTNTC